MATNNLAGMEQQFRQFKQYPCITGSTGDSAACDMGRRRSHALSSPVSSPDKAVQPPPHKRNRAQTGNELSQSSSTSAANCSYDFNLSHVFKPCPITLTIDDFHVTHSEKCKIQEFMSHATSLILPSENEIKGNI